MTILHSTPPSRAPDQRRLEDEAGVEYVDGQIVEKPLSMESAETEVIIASILHAAARASGKARVFSSTLGYKCYPEDPARFRKPDLSLILLSRLKDIDLREGFSPIPADLAVEVLSPGDLAYAVAEKVDEYLQHGFATVWIVTPHTRTVAVYRADGSTSLLHESDLITLESLLPGFSCKVADFFAPRAA